MNFDYSNLPTHSELDFTKSKLFVDLETSGFQHAIPDACTLSIGAVFVNEGAEIVDTFYGIICPTDDLMGKMSPGALAVNGFTEEILRKQGKPAEEEWGSFAEWLKEMDVSQTKTHYVGQNPNFDLAFIEYEAPALVKKYRWLPKWVYDNILLYGVAQSRFQVPYIGEGRKGKGANKLAEALQVDPEPDVHNALEGALLNYRNYMRLAQLDKHWRDTQNGTIVLHLN